jgi:uncharacterized protein with GYD domain
MGLFDLSRRLEAIERRLENIGEKMATLAVGFGDLTAAVNGLVSEEASVVTAIQALQSQIAQGSPVTGAQLDALAAQVTGVTSGLAAAIATSTATSTATGS